MNTDAMGPEFWIALVTSGLLAYPILLMLRAMKSRQTVSQYAPEGHAKKQGTPTMGGLIIIAGFSVAQLWQIVLFDAPRSHYFYFSGPGEVMRLAMPVLQLATWNWALLATFLIFALIGFVDDYVVPRVLPDKRGLGWKQKIVMELVASLAFALPIFGANPLKAALAVFLILFFSNAFNFADGLDWLSGTVLLGLALGLGGIAYETYPFEVLPCLAALVGATIPFLFLNKPPAKVFMGDTGSLPIGAALGAVVATIAETGPIAAPPYSALVPLLIVSIVLIVTLVPVPLQIASVKIRKKKLFLYTPIHHAFEKIGWPESRVVWMYALTQLVLSAAAIEVAKIMIAPARRWARLE